LSWTPEAEHLAKLLGGLPLALEQAGAYIAKHKICFNDYIELLNASRAKMLGEGSRGGADYQKTVADYQKTVATTWLITEDQLSCVARAILQITAFPVDSWKKDTGGF
jgi:hypothetical protein